MNLRRLAVYTVLALIAVSLGGCASIQKALGLKTDLEDKPVKKLEIDLVGSESICPGAQVPVIITAVLDNGERLVTEGAGQGKVTWDNYRVAVDGGQLVQNGLFTLDPDPRVSFGKGAKLVVHSVHHPKKKVEASVDARYDCTFTANFSGRSGRSGANGRPGASGRNGTNEQSTGSSAAPGGDGEDGGDGDDGDDGEPGQDADDIEVYVALAESSEADKPLLKVRVQSLTSDRSEIFLVDPQGGGLTVLANGGHGGHGGNGGNGGSGGSGGMGTVGGSGGDAGDGGNGGNGASGGDGGRIKLVVAPEAKTHLGAISLENKAGSGGRRGSRGYDGSPGSYQSGGERGRSGEDGRDGVRDGRPGKDGPEPVVVFEQVAQVW